MQVLLNFDDSTPLGSNPFKVYLFQLHEKAQDHFGEVILRDGRGVVVEITKWLLEGESVESWKELWGQMPSVSPARYSHDLSFWASQESRQGGISIGLKMALKWSGNWPKMTSY